MKLPDFLVIGAHKAGTSSLYAYLNQHPQIYMSPIKELIFFNRDHVNWHILANAQPADWLTQMPELKTYLRYFEGAAEGQLCGEATTEYLCKLEPPNRIYQLIPNAKFIAILRHPVERAYSHFCHRLRIGLEPHDHFLEAFQQDKQALWTSYRGRGLYAQHLTRYFKLFDRSQIHVLLFEDMIENDQKSMSKIFNFLDVDTSFQVKHLHQNPGFYPKNTHLNRLINPQSLLFRILNKVIPPRGYSPRKRTRLGAINEAMIRFFGYTTIPPMPEEAKQELLKFYYDDILATQDLIQRDLSHWLYIN